MNHFKTSSPSLADAPEAPQGGADGEVNSSLLVDLQEVAAHRRSSDGGAAAHSDSKATRGKELLKRRLRPSRMVQPAVYQRLETGSPTEVPSSPHRQRIFILISFEGVYWI